MLTALPKPTLVRRTGVVLFVLSFVMPTWRFDSIGAGAFVAVPDFVFHFFFGDAFRDGRTTTLMICLLMGWLSNFTVFSSLPLPVTVLAILAPWILFFAMIFLFKAGRPDFWVISRIPFYPWALGIGLVNYSRLMERQTVQNVSRRAQA